jgi:hypothetical protein
MGHFAKVVNGIVENVIVAEQNFIDTLTDKQLWYETSYNIRDGIYYEDVNKNIVSKNQKLATETAGRRRRNFASIGGIYNYERDMFLKAKPFDSWVFDKENFNWKAPKDKPNDNKYYVWCEDLKNWCEIDPNTGIKKV